MIRRAIFLLLLGVVLALPAQAQLIPSFGSDRAGTSGFQFLKIPVDARGAALGETVVADAIDASALFWNPALAAQAEGMQVGLSHTAYFADVSMEYAAITYPLNRLGLTLGGSLQVLNSGDMEVTTEFQPFGTGERFRYVDIAAGLTVSQTLTDLFSYGITAKYVRESVADINTNSMVFDLGVFYRIGTTGVQMAVAIRNFGVDGTPSGTISRTTIDEGTVVEDDFESFTPPTTFLLGLTYNAFSQASQHDLIVSGQLTNPNDNAESFNIGAEYIWHNLLIVRGGYRFGVEEYTLPSAGVGLSLGDILPLAARFDYGFSQLERLGTVHRVGLNLSL
ncbi:MAG TPA: PorV/PorQ family protein [Rhodothermales bacterium]|nr:PorV/PorQ family protein [Rhodothermales bacterium]